ncbi:hypothetical protein H0088_004080 [Salmonella enterica]|nr:hypothetical protein [Salmonella enterica]
MKQLPEIGSKVLTFDGDEVTIVAHHENRAIYIYKNTEGFIRADLGVAGWFIELKSVKPQQTGCKSGEHNYVQVHEAHTNKAFCTRCGTTINLE